MFLTYVAFGPIFALQGRGRNMGSVHAGACFVRARKVQQDSLLRHLWGFSDTQNRDQESLRKAREGPELRQRASRERKIVPENSPADSQKTRNGNSYSYCKTFSHDGKMPINTWENIKLQTQFVDPCICHMNKTFCSAHRNLIIYKSACFEISDALFCAQKSQNL